MAYTPQTWANDEAGGTPITAARLSHIETGVQAAASTADAAATGAQGALADTAVQPEDLAAVATSGSYNDLTDTPSGGGTPDDGSVTAAKFAATALVTEAEGINSSDNDTSFPTTAAVKDYVDTSVAGAGGGDMTTAVYDPTAVGGDAFAMDNMVEGTTTKILTAAERTKLAGVEASADVTDTANVTAAGALMDSEVTNLAAVKAFSPTDYATAAQGDLADSATQPGDLATVATTGAYSDLSGTPAVVDQLTDLDTTVTGAELNALKTKVDGVEAGAEVNDTSTVLGSVNGTPTALTLWTGTSAQYAAIGTKDANTVYVVTA